MIHRLFGQKQKDSKLPSRHADSRRHPQAMPVAGMEVRSLYTWEKFTLRHHTGVENFPLKIRRGYSYQDRKTDL